MPANRRGNRFAHAAHEARVLQLADGRVVRGGDLLELVVPVEVNLPAELFELVDESGLNEVDGARVYAGFGLERGGELG